MGVMKCGRGDCEEILCHRLIETEGGQLYICDDCYRELQDVALDRWPRALPLEEVVRLVTLFMASNKVQDDETVDVPGGMANTLDAIRGLTGER